MSLAYVFSIEVRIKNWTQFLCYIPGISLSLTFKRRNKMDNSKYNKKQKWKEDLEKFRILIEIDFKGNVSKELLDAYEKCLNLEISMDEFCNFVRESSFKAYKNKRLRA